MFKDNVLVRFFREMDKVIIFTALIASAYGLILVYSATYRKLEDGQLFTSDITSMLISIGLGLVFVVIVSNIDYEIISKLWPVIAAGCVILMIITMIWGVAVNPLRDDTRSWLKIGSFTFQTSEILKVGFVISYAYHIDLVKQKINEPLQMAGLVAHGLVPFLLVMFTGDLGSAIIFIVMMIGMLFMARAHILYFVAGAAALAIVTPIAWRYEWISGIQRDRILALFYPEDYPTTIYQQENAKIAMGSGGWTGQGYLNGTYTQSGLVPENQNDMILSVAGEEFGFLGALAVIALLTILILKVFFNGFKARDNVGFLMCSGVAIMLFSQMLINVGMELSLLPCIGITLPLFSAGGSSSLSVYLALGLVLSIQRFSQVPKDTMFYTPQ